MLHNVPPALDQQQPEMNIQKKMLCIEEGQENKEEERLGQMQPPQMWNKKGTQTGITAVHKYSYQWRHQKSCVAKIGWFNGKVYLKC